VAGLWIHAHEVDLGPGGGGGGAQGGQAVAGDALGPNPLLRLRLVKGVHDAFPSIRPAVLDHAMDQQAVHVVGVKNLAVPVNGGEHLVGFAGDFGLEKQLLAGQPLEGALDPVKGAVGLGAIKVGDALVVGVAHQRGERLLPQGELNMAAVGAGAEAQPAEPEAGLAQGHLIHRCAPGRRPGPLQGTRGQQQRAGQGGGTFQKLAAA